MLYEVITQQKAPGAKGFSDHHKVLEQKDLDAVLIATPDHWHSRIAIDNGNVLVVFLCSPNRITSYNVCYTKLLRNRKDIVKCSAYPNSTVFS